MPPTKTHKIVLLDTNRHRRNNLKSLILKWGFVPFVFESDSICLDNLHSLDPDLVISGSLNTEETMRFINSLKVIRSGLPVLILSGDNLVRDYITTSGFSDVKIFEKEKPSNDIKPAVIDALDRSIIGRNNSCTPLIIGTSPKIIKLKKSIKKINQTKENILIKGEPGTGKELFARVIHGHSDRRNHPFIKVNAVKLPYQLLECELFGYQHFNPSNFPRNENGVFSVADQSTFFVKEIGVLPISLQVKLLKLLAGGFHPNGGGGIREPVDVRIIASTTKDLDRLVQNDSFSKELYYRLNVLGLTIPPLRSRKEDIPPLTDFFTYKHCVEFNRSYTQLSTETKEKLSEYHWPGNVKELESMIKEFVLNGNDEHALQNLLPFSAANRQLVTGRHLPDFSKDFPRKSHIKLFLKKSDNYSLKSIRSEYMMKVEQRLVRKALELSKWNRKRAAQLLDISYKSLLNKMKTYNLNSSTAATIRD